MEMSAAPDDFAGEILQFILEVVRDFEEYIPLSGTAPLKRLMGSDNNGLSLTLFKSIYNKLLLR
jgi:hypothetical protein